MAAISIVSSVYTWFDLRSSDGFALNVGSEEWQLDRVADCYAAAEKLMQPDCKAFKLFLSFDMA